MVEFKVLKVNPVLAYYKLPKKGKVLAFEYANLKIKMSYDDMEMKQDDIIHLSNGKMFIVTKIDDRNRDSIDVRLLNTNKNDVCINKEELLGIGYVTGQARYK